LGVNRVSKLPAPASSSHMVPRLSSFVPWRISDAKELGSIFRQIHVDAQKDYRSIKGCRRKQEGYFQSK
jgi:hypothetical protein